MPTYKRNGFLSDHEHPAFNLAKNKLVSKIIVVWHNIGDNVPISITNNIHELGIFNKVEFVYPEKNSLNNRFFPYKTIKTECIFSVDDDFVVTDKALEKCYSLWLEKQDAIVGLTPRYMNGDIGTYHGFAARSKEPDQPYSIILTQAAMFHKKFLKVYWSDEENLKIMDQVFNGEDIMFNFIHNSIAKTEPMYVFDDKVHTWKKFKVNGISTSDSNHLNKRHDIFRLMQKKYGDVLITTNKKYFA